MDIMEIFNSNPFNPEHTLPELAEPAGEDFELFESDYRDLSECLGWSVLRIRPA